PDRKDGLGAAIGWLCGPTIARAERRLDAIVHFAHVPWSGCKVPTKSGARMRGPRLVRAGVTDIVEAEKALLRDDGRVAFIAGEARRAEEGGRQVLILVGLRDHAHRLAEACAVAGCSDPTILMGGQTEAARMRGSPVVATYGSCAKGGDFNPPPTLLILASPRADVRQAMGRALQPQAPCRTIILDLVDGHQRLIKMARGRLRIYQRNDFEIQNDVWPYTGVAS
ncbi:MAG: hypothetical protein GWO24_15660, partial [Akkermansiaceae bacterium]|nr:hypothetical protein [Akkermansiaceae bacterium]